MSLQGQSLWGGLLFPSRFILYMCVQLEIFVCKNIKKKKKKKEKEEQKSLPFPQSNGFQNLEENN